MAEAFPFRAAVAQRAQGKLEITAAHRREMYPSASIASTAARGMSVLLLILTIGSLPRRVQRRTLSGCHRHRVATSVGVRNASGFAESGLVGCMSLLSAASTGESRTFSLQARPADVRIFRCRRYFAATLGWRCEAAAGVKKSYRRRLARGEDFASARSLRMARPTVAACRSNAIFRSAGCS